MLLARDRRYVAATCALAFAIFGAALWIGARDDRAARQPLQVAAPIVEFLSYVGDRFVTRELPWAATAAVGTAACLLVVSLLSRRREAGGDPWHRSLPLVAALAVFGQALLLVGLPLLGLVFYATAFATALRAQARGLPPPFPDPPRRQPWHVAEVLSLSAVVFVATFIRLFALDRIPDGFVGELAAQSAAATSLPGIFRANSAVAGPWAPLGIPYYLPIYVLSHLFGTTLFVLRAASAVVGVFTIVLAYFFARDVAGKTAALLAAIFLCFEPLQIGWSRTDLFPHLLTTWPSIVLTWVSFRAFQTGRSALFVWLAILMGLSWHQYPSGQMAFLIPVLAAAVLFVGNRDVRRKVAWKMPILLAGVAAWACSGLLLDFAVTGEIVSPVSFFNTHVHRLGPRIDAFPEAESTGVAAALPAAVSEAVANATELVRGIFFQAAELSDQDHLPARHGLLARTVSWPVAALGATALFVFVTYPARTLPAVSIAWIVAGALPAILAAQPFPKRGASVFPAVALLAAFACSWIVDRWIERAPRSKLAIGGALIVLFLVWSAVVSRQWISGKDLRAGIPAEVSISHEIAERLRPRTIVIVELSEAWLAGKLTYLLIEQLQRPELQPIVWYPRDYNHEPWESFAARPELALERVQTPSWLDWTPLSRRVPELARVPRWERQLFVFQRNEQTDERIEMLRAVCGAIQVSEHRFVDSHGHYAIVECERPISAAS